MGVDASGQWVPVGGWHTDSEGRELRGTLEAAAFLGVHQTKLAECARKFELTVLRRKGSTENFYVWEELQRARRQAAAFREARANEFTVVKVAGLKVEPGAS